MEVEHLLAAVATLGYQVPMEKKAPLDVGAGRDLHFPLVEGVPQQDRVDSTVVISQGQEHQVVERVGVLVIADQKATGCNNVFASMYRITTVLQW